VSFGFGGGAFGAVDPTGFNDGGLFPTMGGLQAHTRVHNLLRAQLSLDLDVGLGSVNSKRVVDGGSFSSTFDVDVTALQAGAAVLWEQSLADQLGVDLRVGVGPHLAGVLYVHRFVGANALPGLQQQSYLTFNPGVVGVVGWQFAPWAHIELSTRAHYMPYTVDALRHLITLEGGASLWVDL
jgi:hypothetical protein